MRTYEDSIWPKNLPKTIAGIELNTEKQLELLDKFKKFYNESPPPLMIKK